MDYEKFDKLGSGNTKNAILEKIMDKPLPIEDIAEQLGHNTGTVRQAVRALKKMNRVETKKVNNKNYVGLSKEQRKEAENENLQEHEGSTE